MNQIDILKWFLTAGITDCVGETPVDRFQQKFSRTAEKATQVLSQATQRLRRNQPIQPDNTPLTVETSFTAQATALATQATTLSALTTALNQFDGCSLKKTASFTLDGTGISESPTVLCVIDAPKSDDEKAGHLAGGDIGLLLIKMLKAIQLDCAVNTYLAPVIPWRLPGDRKPTDTEIAVCLPFLKQRIELLQPRFILIFGALPVKALLGVDSIAKARQQELSYRTASGKSIPVIATFGPDSVKKGQSYRINAWADLQKLQKMLNEPLQQE